MSEQKHHILIDDVSPEKVLQLQKDGFKPAVFLESSPGNYQCILTFPKFHGIFDRDIGNRLTVILNKRYGDPKLSGAIHPHRAPGFENRKPKHKREDATYPHVNLSYSVRQECQKTLIEARKIEQAFTTAKQHRERLATHSPLLAAQGAANLQFAYFKHWEDIRAHITIEDFSRVDAMIALRLRANGHSQKEVEETIRACAPIIGDRRAARNWQRYAERTAVYAFGHAGDRDMERNVRYQEVWHRVEKFTETKQKRLQMR